VFPEGFPKRPGEKNLGGISVHSGAVSWVSELPPLLPLENTVQPVEMEHHIDDYAVEVARRFWERLGVTSPLTIQVALHNVYGLTCVPREPWRGHPEGGALPLDTPALVFEEETTTSEVQFHKPAVLGRVMDRMVSAFGMWRG
jgi:hypothetical protein